MDSQAKTTALHMIPYGALLLTVKHGDQFNVSTVSWLSQASFEPPLIMVAVKTNTLTHSMVESEGRFAINLLGEKQEAIAQAFFGPAEYEGGKLSGFDFEPAPVSGAPLLLDVPAWFECRTTDVLKRGDHTVIVAEVVEAGVRQPDIAPLLLRDTPWQYGG
jgi:flavin reductase (DIM6/NTAB) family NADH-FMN oxidoreductase RutF